MVETRNLRRIMIRMKEKKNIEKLLFDLKFAEEKSKHDGWIEADMLEKELEVYTGREKTMKIFEVTDRTPSLIDQLRSIWESSVRATHHFLSEQEIQRIKEYVPQAMGGAEHLIVAEDEQGVPVAFMGTDGDRLEMLFLAPGERGKGLGRQLVSLGISEYGVQEVTVNEQNPEAVGFYEHMGFVMYKRTECDEEGGPYPLLYMALC